MAGRVTDPVACHCMCSTYYKQKQSVLKFFKQKLDPHTSTSRISSQYYTVLQAENRHSDLSRPWPQQKTVTAKNSHSRKPSQQKPVTVTLLGRGRSRKQSQQKTVTTENRHSRKPSQQKPITVTLLGHGMRRFTVDRVHGHTLQMTVCYLKSIVSL